MELRPIIFLAYINRSGSTILAKELSYFKDIAVSIEGLEKRFIKVDYEKFLLNNENDIEVLLDNIYNEEKFKSWNIDREELKEEIINANIPLNYNELLKIILNKYFSNDNAQVILYKNIGLFQNLKKSQKIFPNSKYIFIERDPRAIFNSLSKSIDSLTKLPMSRDLVAFVVRYKNIKKKIYYYRKNNNYNKMFYLISYEELIMHTNRTLSKIIKFLNVSSTKRKNSINYFDLIPEEQKHLHESINQNIIEKRINAWQSELSKEKIWFLSFVTKREINECEYIKPEVNFLQLENKFEVIKYLIKFIIKFYPKSLLKLVLIKTNLRNIW